MRVKNKRVKKIALGLVVVMLGGALLSGIAGITGAGSEQSNNADQNSDFVVPKGDPISIDGVLSEDVYTFVCEIPEQQKPELIYFACADGNNGIGKIEWSTWEATGATGVGEYFANDCDPDCANGTFEFTNVNLKLAKAIGVKERVHLTDLTYESVDEGVLSGRIDLSEFYLVMNRNK
jgi:hypothetical protein